MLYFGFSKINKDLTKHILNHPQKYERPITVLNLTYIYQINLPNSILILPLINNNFLLIINTLPTGRRIIDVLFSALTDRPSINRRFGLSAYRPAVD